MVHLLFILPSETILILDCSMSTFCIEHTSFHLGLDLK